MDPETGIDVEWGRYSLSGVLYGEGGRESDVAGLDGWEQLCLSSSETSSDLFRLPSSQMSSDLFRLLLWRKEKGGISFKGSSLQGQWKACTLPNLYPIFLANADAHALVG
ncbi:hypothetical protein NQZ79_g5869 [Umbelopsis isabellina]|nr:hypothetical protein NQZ79_g5869 [Umbelopsis isabellina]